MNRLRVGARVGGVMLGTLGLGALAQADRGASEPTGFVAISVPTARAVAQLEASRDAAADDAVDPTDADESAAADARSSDDGTEDELPDPVGADASADADTSSDDTSVPRFFFEFGYGFGAARAGRDLPADSRVPYDPVNKPSTWNPTVNGPYAPPGYTEAEWANVLDALYGSYLSPGTAPSGAVIGYDGDCDVEAGRYCGRVQSPGFVPTAGLRMSLGYFVTERVGVSMAWRFQTHAGLGTFGRVIGSARVHVRITRPRATGLNVDALVGVGYGQMQLRPDQGRYQGPDLCEVGSVQVGERCDDPAANPTPSVTYVRHGERVRRPFLETGPFVAHVGATVRYDVIRGFGFFARPVVWMLAPRVTFAGELELGTTVSF